MMVERWKNLELRSPSLTYNSLEFCRNRKSSLASHLSSSKFRDALRLMNENDKENEKLVKRDGYIYIYIMGLLYHEDGKRVNNYGVSIRVGPT